MSTSLVMDEIKKKIQNDFPFAEKRVYALLSDMSYEIMESYRTPGVSIVYQGGARTKQKGTKNSIETHRFGIYIYQAVWKDEGVVLGDLGKKGILQLQEELINLLDDYRYTSELPDCRVISAAVTNKYGTEEFLALTGQQGFSGKIGFELTVTEEVINE